MSTPPAPGSQQPSPLRRGFTVAELVSLPHQQLCVVEGMLTKHVVDSLDKLAQDNKLDRNHFRGDHDAAFGTFSDFVDSIWKVQMHWRGVRLWLVELAPRVQRFEQKHGLTLHKGSPIYNTGLLLFLAGDYARASQFITEAGEENTRSGEPSPSRLHVGSGLSEQILVNPIAAWLSNEVGSDYQAGTGRSLDKAECVSLIECLGQRQEDAMVFLSGVHRIAALIEGPDNSASKLQRVRGVADVILAHESGLRRWQVAVTGELFDRSRQMFTQPNWIAAWAAVHGRWSTSPKTTVALNHLLTQEAQAFDTANDRLAKAAIAAYVTYRLRNSLMHVVEPGLNLFTDMSLLKRVLGFALIAIRLSKFGEDNQQFWP